MGSWSGYKNRRKGGRWGGGVGIRKEGGEEGGRCSGYKNRSRGGRWGGGVGIRTEAGEEGRELE